MNCHRVPILLLSFVVLTSCDTSAGDTDAGADSGVRVGGGGVDTDSGNETGTDDVDREDVCEADPAPVCDGVTGLCEGPQPCTPQRPCTEGIAGAVIEVSDPLEALPERCATVRWWRPEYDDGAPLTWVDEETGLTRAACGYRHPDAEPSAPRPLLVYLHGSGGAANAIYDSSYLRDKAVSYDLSGDPARPGFHLLAHQGLYQDVPGSTHAAPRLTLMLRDFDSPSSAPDVRAIDTMIDDFVAGGGMADHSSPASAPLGSRA